MNISRTTFIKVVRAAAGYRGSVGATPTEHQGAPASPQVFKPNVARDCEPRMIRGDRADAPQNRLSIAQRHRSPNGSVLVSRQRETIRSEGELHRRVNRR